MQIFQGTGLHSYCFRVQTMRALVTASLYFLYATVLCFPAGAAPPPQMPPQFDKETVQRLINTAEKGQNATILKIGYFLQRGKSVFPPESGFALLEAAIAQEKAGSKRWFVLQSIRGFAAFVTSSKTKQDGYKAYNEMFSLSQKSDSVGATGIVQRAIYEYSFAMPSEYGVRAGDTQQAREVLLKALQIYLGQQDPNPRAINWARAVKAVNGGVQFATTVEQALRDAGDKKSYALLRAAAAVYQGLNQPERVAALLQQARPLLALQDASQVQSFYTAFVKALVDSSRIAEAISVQQEFVKQTGHGYAQLIELQLQAGDEKAVNQTLTTLNAADASEQEINDTAARLIELYGRNTKDKQQIGDHAQLLLSHYLAFSRERTVEQELRARLLLGPLLISMQNPIEAGKVLNIEHLKQPLPTPTAQALSALIKQWRTRLAGNTTK